MTLATHDMPGAVRFYRALGFTPEFAPTDADWGERYFHITDPDGHEISFARPLA